MAKTVPTGATTSSAKPPEARPAQTRSPTLRPWDWPGATSLTMLATSVPGVKGGVGLF